MMMMVLVNVMMAMMMMMMVIKLARLAGRELQLAPVGVPSDMKKRLTSAASAATRWDSRTTKSEPRQDMSQQAFLQYHTEGDWARLAAAQSIESKVAVFVARAARIGMVTPADNYLRKVRVRMGVWACVCVRVCARVRVCACACVCCARKVCAAVCISCNYDTPHDFRKVVLQVRTQWSRIKKDVIRDGFAASARPCCSTAVATRIIHHVVA